MIPFTLCLLACMITGCLTFMLGSALGFNRGFTDGFDDGYTTAASEIDMSWEITTAGAAAAHEAREPVALSIHESFSNSQPATLNPQLS